MSVTEFAGVTKDKVNFDAVQVQAPVYSNANEPDTVTAKSGHVIDIGGQHDHRTGLAQCRLGDRRIDRVFVAVQTCGLEQSRGRLRRRLGQRLDLDPGEYPLQARQIHPRMADFHDGVGTDDEIGPHTVEHLEHRENLTVLRDPGGDSLGVEHDGFNVLDHAALAEPPGFASPKILE